MQLLFLALQLLGGTSICQIQPQARGPKSWVMHSTKVSLRGSQDRAGNCGEALGSGKWRVHSTRDYKQDKDGKNV